MDATPNRTVRRTPWLVVILGCLVAAVVLAANAHLGFASALAVLGGIAATRLI